jgi:hypothetical protein
MLEHRHAVASEYVTAVKSPRSDNLAQAGFTTQQESPMARNYETPELLEVGAVREQVRGSFSSQSDNSGAGPGSLPLLSVLDID